MAETSLPWSTTYSDDEWSDMFRKMFLTDRTVEGVFKDYLNELEVTGVATPVTVDTGAALVDGKFYENDSSTTVAIPAPAADTRIDCIVLRKSWAGEDVTITRVAGEEGAGAPAITQNDGVTWDIKIAEASIAVGGTITVTDYRDYIYGMWNFSAELIKDGDREVDGDLLDFDYAETNYTPATTGVATDVDQIAAHAEGIDDKLGELCEKHLFPDLDAYSPLSGIDAAAYQVSESSTGDTHKPIFPELLFDDSTDEGRMFAFRMPRTFGGTLKISGQYVMAGSNTSDEVVLVAKITAQEDGDANIDSDSFAAANSLTESVPDNSNELDEFEITMTNDNSVEGGSMCYLLFYRDADDGSDTATGDFKLRNLRITFNGA